VLPLSLVSISYWKYGRQIGFGDKDQISATEHHRIFGDFVLPLRDGNKDDVEMRSHIVARRANEIPDVFDKADIQVEPTANHAALCVP
jgi:hypothetical protein